MFPIGISNRLDNDRQPPCDNPQGCNDDRVSTPAPSSGPPAPDPAERRRKSWADFLRDAFDQQTAEIKAVVAEAMNRPHDSESYLQIVAACQKEAAEFANHVLERHVLHPAIETVDSLATLIDQLQEQAASFVDGQTHCPVFQALLDAIAEAAKMAQAKRDYLDIESVCPDPLDESDSVTCEIRQAVQTDDPDMHKRVERTLVPGLRYRGAVLRRAKVSVYRHVEKNNDIERSHT